MAINVSELHKGNYIMLGDKPERVYSIIYDRNKGYAINHENYLADWYEPIVITEDILRSCKFVFNSGVWEYEGFKLEYVGSHCQYCKNGYVGEPFQYVHEFQNVFYWITRTELPITL